jgi:hypothetical protein
MEMIGRKRAKRRPDFGNLSGEEIRRAEPRSFRMETHRHVASPFADHKTSSRRTSRIPWRHLSLADLEAFILEKRRSSVERHLALREWRELDRARKHLAVLKKSALQ